MQKMSCSNGIYKISSFGIIGNKRNSKDSFMYCSRCIKAIIQQTGRKEKGNSFFGQSQYIYRQDVVVQNMSFITKVWIPLGCVQSFCQWFLSVLVIWYFKPQYLPLLIQGEIGPSKVTVVNGNENENIAIQRIQWYQSGNLVKLFN